MKKTIKLFTIFSLVISILCCSVFCNQVGAVEPKSGGLVSIDYSVVYKGSPKTTYQEYPLSAKHYHNSNVVDYSTVTSSISKTVSSSVSVTVSGDVLDQLEVDVGFGASVSSGLETSHSYTVSKDGYYQIMYKVTFKEQNFTQIATATYYDTSIGYYTTTHQTNSSYKIPVDEYVYCKYTEN